MGFEVFRPFIGVACVKDKFEMRLNKSFCLHIPRSVISTLNIINTEYYIIYIDRKDCRLGIKFIKEKQAGNGKRDYSVRKSVDAGRAISLPIKSALASLGVNVIKFKEVFNPTVIDGLIILDVKHLAGEIE